VYIKRGAQIVAKGVVFRRPAAHGVDLGVHKLVTDRLTSLPIQVGSRVPLDCRFASDIQSCWAACYHLVCRRSARSEGLQDNVPRVLDPALRLIIVSE
jgi:hypothetical protein